MSSFSLHNSCTDPLATTSLSTDEPEANHDNKSSDYKVKKIENECDAEELELNHVTKVYSVIAQHFSNTRHKPWPLVQKFLNGIEQGALVADIGCGNGKYLSLNSHYQIIGLDLSKELLLCSSKTSQEVLMGDSLHLPFKSGKFDYSISIAVIHHFSTKKRRLQALSELFRITKGKTLVFVWALEQDKFSQELKENKQDIYVPWKHNNSQTEIYQRYYHLFKKGELESLMEEVGFKICESGYDAGNWWVIAAV
jgi:tRNA (uracil-5-)-methyltransferase TRM9